MSSNITYEDALQTLSSMFGPPWTSDLLDSVLRHYKGHMENTVEAILCYGGNNPQEFVMNLGQSGNTPSTGSGQEKSDEALARELAAQEEKERRTGNQSNNINSSSSNNNSNSSISGRKLIGTPCELPSDFLRIPGLTSNSSSGTNTNYSSSGGLLNSSTGTPSSTLDADEALARMLQDDLFTEELVNNPEFAHLARGRLPTRNTASSIWSGPPGSSARRNNNTAQPAQAQDGPNIVDKISELGENAKKKLSLLATQWQNSMMNSSQKQQQQQNAAERSSLLGGGGGNFGEEDDLNFASNSSPAAEMTSFSSGSATNSGRGRKKND
eukprot:CAMPEP_0178962690 /NCGR_PEP_ID=MMETSP0789-20121207/14518_1 /TAXON_ID=3005 /ORGANISM="Rhizosolenia setigera, Strain CCMP 1694" /LENGTH=325 /DNA_ID=CAMNT_0020646895 /DNA_START=69 /DNA_END=1046 /DNA_ORIENTATION=+